MKQTIYWLCILLVFVGSLKILTNHIAWSNRIIYVAPVTPKIHQIKSYDAIRSFAKTLPQGERFIKVIACESQFKQFGPDGTVLKHYNKNGTIDYGVAQINSIHIEEAKKMGIDVFTLEGNLAFAKYLLGTKQGISHWVCNSLV